ncbi:MAG: hypothetical protein C3F02_01575 [Parcubacteria group bacterium]|nr:MAG: hypothetical protein C3F02_01575 [Parcubacteria group bacterium]
MTKPIFCSIIIGQVFFSKGDAPMPAPGQTKEFFCQVCNLITVFVCVRKYHKKLVWICTICRRSEKETDRRPLPADQ